MSYANLVKELETKGRVRLRGGQCEGRVEVTNANVTVNRYTPSTGKGAEYAAKFRAEEDQAYFEMMAKVSQGLSRIDVTGNGGESQMEQPEELTSIGTVPNLRELNREELTQVYNRYNFDPIEPSEHLETIFNEKDQILRLIDNNQVCIIKGPTGCGKSTQIPQFILDAHAARQKHCNIIVTQPRRIAAISLAQRVCQERGWGEPGGIVGYQVGLDKKVEEDTRILYCTTGVLLEKLIHAKHMNDYTHILLDEVHEREEDMDFLMLVVRKFLRTNSPNVKIVLMSATIDVSRFANYFKVYLRNTQENAPSYEIKRESKYAVQVYYLDGLGSLVKSLPAFSEDEPGISHEGYMLVPAMIRAFNNIDAEDFRCKRSSEKKGAVLIFLPGLHQIETLYEILAKEDASQHQSLENPNLLNLWLCPLHSSITKDEQEKVMAYAPPDKRKIILSTNIAESSLTITDVKYVIDFCLTKHLVSDPITGFTSLQMDWASHTNCIQREGRVGRVQDGRVYRMVPKTFYQFKMAKESVPEMRRCPLDIVVLKCKRLLEDECPLKLISNALDPPDLDNYEKTILKLKEIGALLKTCRGESDANDGDLTFMGRVMGSLPLDIRITKLILLGHVFDVLEEAIIMGCAMSVRNVFSEPFQRRLDAYNNKLLWANSSESDAVAYLNAYLVWRNMTAIGRFQRSKGNERVWGRSYMLQIRHLKEVALQEEDIKKRLRHFNIQIARYKNKGLWNDMEKPLILKLVLAGSFYPNYFSCSAQNPNAEAEAVKMLGGQNPYQCVYLQNMPHPAPLYFDQVKAILHDNDISKNIELHHDSSQKLIVEFKQTKVVEQQTIGNQKFVRDMPGDIVMPVYRAIKMRQLNIPFIIRVYPPSVAKEKLNALVLNSRSSMNSLSAQLSEYRPAIPWDQQMVEMVICHIEDAGHFFGQIMPLTEENLRKVHHLLNMGNLLCELSGEVEDGAIYAAPFQDEGGPPSFYRAKVTKIHQKDNHHRFNYVDVFFIDFGNSVNCMQVQDLREIVNEEVQKELDKIPPLAVKCILAEVAPAVWGSERGDWSKEATEFVKKTVNSPEASNTWTTQIYSYVNGVASVYLYLEEEGKEGRRPLTLNNLLIKKGYAKDKEENYLSKENHRKRQEIANGVAPYDRMENINVFKSFNKDLMALPFTEIASKHLKGPHSPLEMKLYSKVKSCVQRDVRVEWNSVNSVLLDSDPNDPHEKLLVSGYVSQSADGRKLMLNHTTVLPALYGLPALVCLIFSPTVELRSDEFRSRYTGALCGLGSDEASNGFPLFPENDMEIKFDVEFTNEDLEHVNKLRFFLNQRLCGLDSEEMSENQIFNMHKNVRNLTMKLLTKQRRPVKVDHCPNPFCWGLVNEDYLLAPYESTIDKIDEKSIYPLHHAIDLSPKNDYKYIQDLLKRVKNMMSFVENDLQPRELVCDLCDLDFPYWKQMKEHVQSRHHLELLSWLESRAVAHGLSFRSSPRLPPPSLSVVTTTESRMDRPSTSKQSMFNKPTTKRY